MKDAALASQRRPGGRFASLRNAQATHIAQNPLLTLLDTFQESWDGFTN